MTAEIFAANALFEIEIDKSFSKQNNIIYVDISRLSYMQDEKQILFDLGTLFHVTNVAYNDDRRLWYLSLITIADDDKDIKNKQYNKIIKISNEKNIDEQLPYVFLLLL
ncbi:unnamed protein product [Rotaria sp. Silwood2]|nr:unnamed protein product [Rotaria sp. Silwood2]CAF3030531.1 unnamed protein product [Rotaria sp. Silwood2]CAF3465401.1 unnamed protein product [Rotaria sp. Silwood2]CAF4268332.1 unnamed protein product [Rotaria sp. Silwood2]CAF4643220.1 unnamed protein product [Rotaria sp. Silwood2]